jgi:hypothetical protein
MYFCHTNILLTLIISKRNIFPLGKQQGFFFKVENAFYRYKTILGEKLRSRREESRHVEMVIGCNILNRFLEIGRCLEFAIRWVEEYEVLVIGVNHTRLATAVEAHSIHVGIPLLS